MAKLRVRGIKIYFKFTELGSGNIGIHSVILFPCLWSFAPHWRATQIAGLAVKLISLWMFTVQLTSYARIFSLCFPILLNHGLLCKGDIIRLTGGRAPCGLNALLVTLNIQKMGPWSSPGRSWLRPENNFHLPGSDLQWQKWGCKCIF